MNTKAQAQFERYASYYDLIYSDKDYQAETAYIHSLLLKYGLQVGSILELGSGTGQHGRMLGDLGYNVIGVEVSPSMLQRSTISNNFIHVIGDARTFKIDKKFNAVISLFHVLSYQTLNEDVDAVFKTARAHLNEGGIFVFDVWYAPAVCELKPETRVKRFQNNNLEITRIAEPKIHSNINCVDVKYTLFAKESNSDAYDVVEELHRLRYFSTPELVYVASNNGFKLVQAEEFLTGAPPSENTWGVCFVMQRI